MFSMLSKKFSINPSQDGGCGVGQKGLSHQFSPITSTNVGITPKTLLLVLIPHWCKISWPYQVPVPNY